MERQTIRIRRVGTVTFGILLIIMGTLFLAQLFFPTWDYFLIYRFWPVVFIFLGIEVLLGTRKKIYEILNEKGGVIEQHKTVYDFPAILLMMVLIGFSVCMAMMDYAYKMNYFYWG